MTAAFAPMAVERVLNSLPEGLLIAFCAWLLLRFLGRQNAGTRFAVWLVALLTVTATPFLSGLTSGSSFTESHSYAPVTLSGSWAAVLFFGWCALAAVALARVAAGVWQVRRIRGACKEVRAEELDPVLADVIRQTKRPVRLLVSDRAKVPSALGFRNPAVVLPAWILRDLTPAEIRPVLIHELAHLERRDDWTNLLQKTVRAIFFFHPAVWWIDSRMSMEREMACDDAVLAATGNAKGYAATLIGLLERSCARQGWTMAQAAVARSRDASVRIARILKGIDPAGTKLGRAAIGLGATLSVACSGVVLCAPRIVIFAPHTPAHAAFGPAMEARDVREARDLRLSPFAVVPAAFHPARAAEKPALFSAAAHTEKSRPVDATHRVRHTSQLAKPVLAASVTDEAGEAARQDARQNARADAEVLVVVATMNDGFGHQVPVLLPAGLPAFVIGEQIRQMQEMQWMEENAMAWHMQMMRLMFVLPPENSTQDGSMNSSI